ncbi:MAG: hypothetical protein LRY71_16070 [Bacillaceae bacterium]|nr:hypothetical protein [Bacillaceae bacterium]
MKPSIELFKEKAKSLEKRFLNRWKRQGFYKTVLGKKNFFTKVDRHYLYFCTEGEGKRLLKIARNKVREAISYLHFKRTSIRKELEKFSKYSSALFGILETIFGSLVKKQRCPSGLVRLTLKGTRFFPSGCCRKGDLELIKASGGKFVMLSYYDIHDNSTWLSHLVRLNLYAIIDSGAFSFYRTKGQQKETDYYPLVDVPEIPLIDRYLSFINQYKDYPNVIVFLTSMSLEIQ